jgi:hypothetical protein
LILSSLIVIIVVVVDFVAFVDDSSSKGHVRMRFVVHHRNQHHHRHAHGVHDHNHCFHYYFHQIHALSYIYSKLGFAAEEMSTHDAPFLEYILPFDFFLFICSLSIVSSVKCTSFRGALRSCNVVVNVPFVGFVDVVVNVFDVVVVDVDDNPLAASTTLIVDEKKAGFGG